MDAMTCALTYALTCALTYAPTWRSACAALVAGLAWGAACPPTALAAAEVLRNAGFDPYAYRGHHGQSIEMAIQYYACYGRAPGFYKHVNGDNARECPNHAQYDGKVVNGVDANVVMGALRFPQNPAIAAVESTAKEVAATGAFALDTIRFGKWRD